MEKYLEPVTTTSVAESLLTPESPEKAGMRHILNRFDEMTAIAKEDMRARPDFGTFEGR